MPTLLRLVGLPRVDPDQLLTEVDHDELGSVAASFRPRADGDPVITATKTAIRILGRRVLALDDELATIDALLKPLVVATAPRLLEVHGVGVDTAATLLVAAGDNPDRLRSESAWAHLCGTAPIPASSGKVTRWRLNRGGDRQANGALWVVVITRIGPTPAPRLRRAAPRRGKVEARDQPHPQALRRKRDLPLPASQLDRCVISGGDLAQ